MIFLQLGGCKNIIIGYSRRKYQLIFQNIMAFYHNMIPGEKRRKKREENSGSLSGIARGMHCDSTEGPDSASHRMKVSHDAAGLSLTTPVWLGPTERFPAIQTKESV